MEDSSSSTASPEPLLRPPHPASTPTRLATLLGRAAAGRRGGAAPGLVRETAARQLEAHRADWSYSRPVVALDVAWNLAFVAASFAVLSSTLRERPNVPIRLWIAGYALQCVVHVALVLAEYRRRSSRRWRRGSVESGMHSASSGSEGDDSEEEEGGRSRRSRMAKHCESLNTVVSFFWWILGFYFVVSGGETLLQSAPTLYWLGVIFLAFDVFFAIFCVALACVIGIALCCCLPCIIAILYAVAGQDGASEADISLLPRYRFVKPITDEDKAGDGEGLMVAIGNSSGDSTHGRSLLKEDAECCICLTAYEDRVELHSLPCNHHFHSTCISKWLRINATCPLCKFNILKGNE